MDFIPFNSRLTYHKDPFGAVKEGTKITLRIVMPRNYGCTGADVKIHKDGEMPYNIPMTWDGMQGKHEEWWKATFTAGSAGLYYYHFCIYNCYGESLITRFDNSIGFISSEGGDFFFTVYEKDFRTPDNIKGSVIYQIFPDRFCFSGEKKDNPYPERIIRDDWGKPPMWNPDEAGRINSYDFFQGDFKGIESKLPYLASLGVGCIYLNPIFLACSNHRYDTADYEKIDPLLGTEKDFTHLCKKAKDAGIDIILDGVFSHTGSDSKYFNKEKHFGSKGAYNDKKSPYYGWYKFTEYPNKYDCWWGVDILPEIDEENDSYIAYISKVLKKWQKAGASGWRLDVADELPDKFLDALRQTAKAENENALILGEVWEDASIKISYGQRRRYLQGRQLDSVMNYPFANALADFAVTGIAEGFNDKILEITENYPKCAVDCLMNHIGTHDTCRILNRLGTLDSYESDPINRYTGEMTKEERDRGRKLLKMVSAMQFTLPGVPCIYYGDEVGTEGGVDPFNRGCYPYGAEDEEMLEHYRMLGRIRKEHPVFIDGIFSSVSCVMGCVAYERRGRGERIITVANRNPCTISYYLPDSGFVSLTGQRVNGKELLLEADSAAILYMRCD